MGIRKAIRRYRVKGGTYERFPRGYRHFYRNFRYFRGTLGLYFQENEVNTELSDYLL